MAIHLNRLYTRSGDDGTTGLVGGARLPKTALRIECYGTSDELLAHLGLLRAHAAASASARLRDQAARELVRIQNELFDLGSLLASPPGPVPASMPRIEAAHVERLEREIDAMTDSLPPLKSFVLPGGSLLTSQSHVARTVARRLERRVLQLHHQDGVDEAIRLYLNRLSDWLFAYARRASCEEGVGEPLWVKGPDRP